MEAEPFIVIWDWVARNYRRIVLFLALFGLAVLALAFAHAWDSVLPYASPRARCFETFWTAQWPKWIGCAMAAHESLAAGLIGLWAAIFAGWLAYSGIQMQIEEDREKVALNQIAAKQTAIAAIAQAIHAVAWTLYAVTQAQKAKNQQQIEHWDGSIDRGVSYIDECLNRFTVREAIRDLRMDDRVLYVAIVATLNTFVTINKGPLEHLDRNKRLKNHCTTLMTLQVYLDKFDSDLAAVYDRDSKFAQQS